MKLCSAGLAIAIIASSYCSALPPERKERVHEQQKLSGKEHEVGGEHNNDYDHDAFLGEQEAKQFDQLSPEESKEKLGYIVDKIDRNHDSFVTEEELQQWIQYVQKKYVIEDTDRMWKEHELDDSKLTWDSYRKRTYGYEYDPEEAEDYADMVKRDERKFAQADEDHDGKLSKEEFASFLHPEEHEHMKDIVVLGDDSEEFKEMLRRDERRFRAADVDQDGKLNFEEFTAFRHPEEFKHMNDIVTVETLEDIDKDKDGKISLEEYIADIYDEEDEEDDEDDDDDDKDGVPDWVNSEIDQFKHFRDKDQDGFLNQEEVRTWVIPDDYDNSATETKHLFSECDTNRVGDMWPNKEEEEPEWVKGEREQFSNYRDTNGDGFMDNAEVKHWIIPPNYDHSEAEAKHLIYETDENKDGMLTKQEILDKYDIFVGSQATDFGDALTRHDEF